MKEIWFVWRSDIYVCVRFVAHSCISYTHGHRGWGPYSTLYRLTLGFINLPIHLIIRAKKPLPDYICGFHRNNKRRQDTFRNGAERERSGDEKSRAVRGRPEEERVESQPNQNKTPVFNPAPLSSVHADIKLPLNCLSSEGGLNCFKVWDHIASLLFLLLSLSLWSPVPCFVAEVHSFSGFFFFFGKFVFSDESDNHEGKAMRHRGVWRHLMKCQSVSTLSEMLMLGSQCAGCTPSYASTTKSRLQLQSIQWKRPHHHHHHHHHHLSLSVCSSSQSLSLSL